MDYSKLSDFEINKEVLIKTQYYDDIRDRQVKKDSAVSWGDGCNWHRFDPCNNPADAWPVIEANRIGIIPAPEPGEWKAAHRGLGDDGTPQHFNKHANPLRAAMIVFLMMKDAEK